MRRALLVTALAAVSMFAIPSMASAQVDTTEASDFAEQFVRDNTGDLVRGTTVRNVRVLGCLDVSTTDEDAADCAFVTTLQRRTRSTRTGSCDPLDPCAEPLSLKSKNPTPRRRAATRWVCLGVVRVTLAVDPVDEASDFDGEFSFDDCVRLRTRAVATPLR